MEAASLAARLDAVNRQRQDLEAGMMQAAHDAADAQAVAGRAVLMVHGLDWHPGVVGIVAGRIKQRQNRPALAAAVADGLVKGSGRSVDGIDLGAAVLAARREGLLLTGGGHAMAAGFSLPLDRLTAFHEFLDDRLSHAATLPRTQDLVVEGAVAVPGATVALAEHVSRLAPFGAANEEPVFALSRATVVRADRIGKDGTTLRVMVEGEGGGPRLKVMLFRGADSPLGQAVMSRAGPMHLAGHLRAEAWNDKISACFVVMDAAAA